MPFIMKKGSNYFWPVKHKSASSESTGKQDTQTFDAEFKRLANSRLKELLRDDKVTDEAFCAEVLIGWRGIQNADKLEVPFSESAREELLEEPGMAKAISIAYLESVAGEKAKN